MIKLVRFYGIFLIGIAMASCTGNQGNTEPSGSEGITAANEVISIDDFMNQVEGLVGEEVKVSGLVNHVCRHGGQRMFIVGNNDDSRMKIITSENIAEFAVDLEGSDIIVTGIVEEERIDEAYLAEWEAELEEEEASHDKAVHDGTEHAHEDAELSEKEQALQRIAEYRTEIDESEKGYLAFYSIKALRFEEQ